MPSKINESMLAPCGVNCIACYVHLKRKKPCPGCNIDSPDKLPRCRNCSIKNCVSDKGFTFCFQCSEFPCKQIKNMDKNYRKRYSVSLIENGEFARDNGMRAFMDEELSRWECPDCGGIISQHDKICSECER